MIDLYSHFRDNIDPCASRLMDEVEAYSNTKLKVTLNSKRNTMGIYPYEGYAEIILDKMNFLRHSAFHELLHLKRFWIDRIPKIVCKVGRDDLHDIVLLTETHIDHPIMAKEEESNGYGALAWWTRVMGDMNSFRYKLSQPQSIVRDHSIILSLIYRDAMSPSAYRFLESQTNIRSHNASRLLKASNIISDLLKEDRKLRALKLIFDTCGLSTNGMRIKFHDIKNRTWVYDESPSF